MPSAGRFDFPFIDSETVWLFARGHVVVEDHHAARQPRTWIADTRTVKSQDRRYHAVAMVSQKRSRTSLSQSGLQVRGGVAKRTVRLQNMLVDRGREARSL
jgi:hypothetical protein